MTERRLIDKDQALQFRAENGSLHTLKVTNDGELYFEEAEGAPSTDAVAMWKASSYDGSSQLLKDLSGNGHHLKFGSSHPAYVTNGYLVLPGQAGNYASTPDSAAVSITGDIDIRVKVALDDWTPSGDSYLVSSWTGEGYAFRINGASGLLTFQYNSSGIDQFRASTVAPSVSDGSALWLRVTRSASSGNVSFYTSSDGTAWTQLGSTVSGAAGSMDNSGSTFLIGALNSGAGLLKGKIYWVELRNGIDGPVVAKFDPSSQLDNTTSWTASTGETWTVNSSAATDGSDPLYLPYSGEKYINFPGVPGNHVRIPDASNLRLASTDTFVVTAAITIRAETASENSVVSKRAAGASDGWALYYIPTVGNTRLRFYFGTDGSTWNNVTSSALPSTYLNEKVWVRASGNGASTPTITFSYSTDGNTWTVLNSVAMSGTGVYGGSSTDLVTIGARADGISEAFNGAIHTIRLDKNASTVLNLDLSMAEPESNTFLAVTGQTATINRSSSGRKTVVVDRDLFLFGADDYMEAVDSSQLDIGPSDSLTAVIAYRSYGTVSFQRLLTKTYDRPGWELLYRFSNRRGGMIVGDASFNRETAEPSNQSEGGHLLAGRLDRSNNTVATFVDGVLRDSNTTNVATLGDLSNDKALRVGRQSTPGSNFADMEFIGAAIWRRALTDEEISYLAGEFGV